MSELRKRPVTESESAQRAALLAEALSLVGHDWQPLLEDWVIEVHGTHNRLRGLAILPERTILIMVRDGDPPEWIARVLAHELGHAIDYEHLTPGDRALWLSQRETAGTAWYPVNEDEHDFATGAGDFAEAYATLVVETTVSRSELGEFSETDLELVATLLEEAAN